MCGGILFETKKGVIWSNKNHMALCVHNAKMLPICVERKYVFDKH